MNFIILYRTSTFTFLQLILSLFLQHIEKILRCILSSNASDCHVDLDEWFVCISGRWIYCIWTVWIPCLSRWWPCLFVCLTFILILIGKYERMFFQGLNFFIKNMKFRVCVFKKKKIYFFLYMDFELYMFENIMECSKI